MKGEVEEVDSGQTTQGFGGREGECFRGQRTESGEAQDLSQDLSKTSSLSAQQFVMARPVPVPGRPQALPSSP